MGYRSGFVHVVFLAVLLVLPGIVSVAAVPGPEPEVSVDPRVELVSIVFYLSGGPAYTQPSQYQPYRQRVDRWFSPFEDHPAVRYARKLREQDGISFDAPMKLAIRISPDPAMRLLVPLGPGPQPFDARWRRKTVRKFLKRLRDFRRDSRFDAFFRENRPLYDEVSGRLSKTVHTGLDLQWFPAFFGAGTRQEGSLHVVAGMLLGGCNYGPSVTIGGQVHRYTILGVWRTDATGRPVFQADDMATLVHELCHTYSNPVVDRWLPELQPSLAELDRRNRAAFERQGYGGPRTLGYESMVRALVGRYLLDTGRMEAARAHEEEQKRLEFLWVGDLTRLLSAYEADRDRYPDLHHFMPRIVTFFRDWVATHPAPPATPAADR